MGSLESRQPSNANKVKCFYPRFLTLFLNDKLSNEHVLLFANAPVAVSPVMKSNLFTSLARINKFPNIPVVAPEYMAPFVNIVAAEPAQEQDAEPQPLQVIYPTQEANPSVEIPEPQVGPRDDQEAEIQQSPTQVVEPQTESSTQPSSRPRKKKQAIRKRVLKRVREVGNEGEQGGSSSAPTALSPPTKKSNIQSETTVSPSVSSQQDADIEMAIKQSLDPLSQQGESIEIRPHAKASCKESSTTPTLTLEEPNTDIFLDTLQGEHREEELTETVSPNPILRDEDQIVDSVMDQVPSQAYEGQSESLPQTIESDSTLPEQTLLDPTRDVSLADLSGESERQLGETATEAIQHSIPKELVVSTKEGDLRTPIAPSVTLPERAMMIFSAGTDKVAETELNTSVVRQTPSETHAREISETHLSASKVSAHTHSDLLLTVETLQKQLQLAQAEITQYKAQADLSSTSASVTEQLTIVRNEVENVKTSMLIRTKNVEDIQGLIAEDVKEIKEYMNERIDEMEKRLTKEIATNELISNHRFDRLDKQVLQLDDCMKKVLLKLESVQTSTTTVEDSSTKGEKAATGGEQEKEERRAQAEDQSTQGEKDQRKRGGEASSKGKGKMQEPSQHIPDDFYYQGEQDDFDAYSEQAEHPGMYEEEEEGDFSNWTEVAPTDPRFEKEFLKQKADLRRREDELDKTSQIITKKAELQKAENAEKQRLHDIKVSERKMDVKLKVGDNWDAARKMMSTPQKGTNNDHSFLQLLDRYRSVNPDNSVYMDALKIEISRISAGFDRVSDELKIYVYCHKEGSFNISLHFFENRTLSELWTFLNKVSRSSELNELLRDKIKEFAYKASPQVVQLPYSVKFLKQNILQTCNFDSKSMKTYSAKHMVWMEDMLRTTGFVTQDKIEAADLIQSYCMDNMKKYNQMKNKLKGARVQPVRPVGHTTESDRVYDKDLLSTLEREMEDAEEGEIRKEDN